MEVVDLSDAHVERGAEALHCAYLSFDRDVLTPPWDDLDLTDAMRDRRRAQARAAIKAGAVFPTPPPKEPSAKQRVEKAQHAAHSYIRDGMTATLLDYSDALLAYVESLADARPKGGE